MIQLGQAEKIPMSPGLKAEALPLSHQGGENGTREQGCKLRRAEKWKCYTLYVCMYVE